MLRNKSFFYVEKQFQINLYFSISQKLAYIQLNNGNINYLLHQLIGLAIILMYTIFRSTLKILLKVPRHSVMDWIILISCRHRAEDTVGHAISTNLNFRAKRDGFSLFTLQRSKENPSD